MSPGRFTVKYTPKLANSLKRKRLLQAQRSAKLKSERLSKDATHSVLEGETYSTNIGFDECTDKEDITIPSKEFSVDSSSLIVFLPRNYRIRLLHIRHPPNRLCVWGERA